ncbi:MAG: GNAT family N-acetyltransferase [Halobacteriales archaeon]
MDDLDIRRATEQDLEGIVTLYRSAYRETSDLGFPRKAANATAAGIKAGLDDDSIHVAILEGTIVGAVRSKATSSARTKVSRLGIHPEWQGNGIGRLLLKHVETQSRQAGAETAWLTTPEGHPYLADFYRDCGYERTSDNPLEYRDYDEIVMEKALG